MKSFYLFGFLLLTVLFAESLHAQCISGNCQNGSGIFKYPSGARYIGQFQNSQINGIGSCYYTDGSKYQGEWQNGRPHGNGIKIMPDGTRQEGVWEMGKLKQPKTQVVAKSPNVPTADGKQTGCISGNCRDGKGIYIYPSGAVYIGEFLSGEIHGVGVCYYSDGRKYQGQWNHRFPEGQGTMTYPDGNKRTGKWKKGQPIDERGQIVESLTNQPSNTDGTDIQSGCISGDCQNGDGVFAYADGSRYEGKFQNGKPEYKGTFTYPNEDKYIGAFKEGVPHGSGRLLHADGTVTTGQWKEGEFIGTNEYVDTRQLGCIQGDCQNGTGQYIFKDGARYNGQFRNGKPHGKGSVTYLNGEKYVGELAHGKFNGQGTLYRQDGTNVSGFWKDDFYQGLHTPIPTRPSEADQVVKADNFSPNLKIWAVVIGVATYNHMPVLRYTDDDAYRIYAFLKSPAGGALDDDQIRILIDEEATKKNIMNTMTDIFGKAGKNDLILLYFSGHGLKGSFLPYDFDGYNNKLLHEEINTILDGSDAKYKLAIADACHSGSLLAMRSTKVPNMLNNFYQTLAKSNPGTALIMSSKSDETSLESSGLRQGVFSHFLIRGLKGEADANDNKIVSIQELFKFVFEKVRSYTGNQQSPVIQGDYDQDMPVSVRK